MYRTVTIHAYTRVCAYYSSCSSFSSPGHGQAARERARACTKPYIERYDIPTVTVILLFSLELGRKSTTSFISRSVTPRKGITSWVAANCATSICAAGAGAVLYRMRDVTTSYILVDSSSNHVRVTLLRRECLYRDIRRWILSLLFWIIVPQS